MSEKWRFIRREWRIQCHGLDENPTVLWVDVTHGRVAIGPGFDESYVENYLRMFKGSGIVEFRDAINEAMTVTETAEESEKEWIIRCYDAYGDLAVCSLGTDGKSVGIGVGPNQGYLYVCRDDAVCELRDSVTEAAEVAAADRRRPAYWELGRWRGGVGAGW